MQNLLPNLPGAEDWSTLKRLIYARKLVGIVANKHIEGEAKTESAGKNAVKGGNPNADTKETKGT